jgi:DNA-binding CsgD family transcriptional regulator
MTQNLFMGIIVTSDLLKANSATKKIILFSLVFVVLLVIDQWVGYQLGATSYQLTLDLLLELPRLFITVLAFSVIWKHYTKEKHRSDLYKRSLRRGSQLKKTSLKKKSLVSFEKQFENWGLSKSEREVAMLVLKGKMTKEIAKLRFTSDRTIRNQCQAIYEKTGLSGRHELAGYFIAKMLPETKVNFEYSS